MKIIKNKRLNKKIKQNEVEKLFEDHKQKILTELNIDPPTFIIGKKAIKEQYKEEGASTISRILLIIRLLFNDPSGTFFWGNCSEGSTGVVWILDKKKVGTLAHELRHVYQYQKETFIFSYTIEKSLNYLRSPKEKDANEYAYLYCKTNNIRTGIIKYLITLHFLEIIGFILIPLIALLVVIITSNT
ncbi:hypothetical protein [Bacillus sp. 1P06AnD]|uniref:hypothetical protein n=1 Tax=Bacillus sp. 1P06AnD TaxID=3132208 RepID=UPI00399EED4F